MDDYGEDGILSGISDNFFSEYYRNKMGRPSSQPDLTVRKANRDQLEEFIKVLNAIQYILDLDVNERFSIKSIKGIPLSTVLEDLEKVSKLGALSSEEAPIPAVMLSGINFEAITRLYHGLLSLKNRDLKEEYSEFVGSKWIG